MKKTAKTHKILSMEIVGLYESLLSDFNFDATSKCSAVVIY